MENLKKKDNTVLYISFVMTAFFAIWGIFGPVSFGNVANAAFDYLTVTFGWFYLLAVCFFVIFVFVLAFGRYGKIKLGDDDSVPEYSTGSWFAMLFSAGMGIGLIFYGVAEPVTHFAFPQGGLEAGSQAAASWAMMTSWMHWGIHPWAIFGTVALPLAYMQFRKKKPALISSLFIPLLGEERVNGPIGKAIDVLAVFATVAGVATSLGLGTLQINSGINYLFGVPINRFVQSIIMLLVTAAFITSAATGIEKGILWLSNTNLFFAALIMVLTFIVGPSIGILNTFTNTIGAYITEFVSSTFSINNIVENDWLGGWRIFYWAWWIAWAPFVGSFIARISKGRTIREFVLATCVLPPLGGFIWFSVLGGTALNLGLDVAVEAAKVTETAAFVVMQHVPLGSIISLIIVILVCTFFVTSADSATFVLGMFTENGNLNPTNRTKITWGIMESLLAYALLFSGGLQALQTSSIVAAFPFTIIMIFSTISFIKIIREENLDRYGNKIKVLEKVTEV